jgi:hypothetical protein
MPVKARRPCADIDCILEQRKTFVKHAGRRVQSKTEERGMRREEGGGGRGTEVGGWSIHVRT